MRKKLFVTFQVPGFHCWPDAPPECEYLSSVHRHMFHVRVELAVDGDNREVEFIAFKNQAQNAFVDLGTDGSFDGVAINYGSWSCEQLASALFTSIATSDWFVGHIVAIEVSEDGENGARLEWD